MNTGLIFEQRNTATFVIYRSVSRLYFYLPILVMLFVSNGYTYLQVGILISAYSAAVFIAEIPVNLIIRSIAAKTSIIAGEGIKAAGLVALASSTSFHEALLAQIAMGFGYAIAAAGDSVVMTSSRLDSESYDRVQRVAHVMVLSVVISASIIGGVVAQFWSAVTAVWISAPAPVLAALVAYFFDSTSYENNKEKPASQRQPCSEIFKHPNLLMGILNYGITRAIFMSMFVAFIPMAYLILYKVPMSAFGAIIASYTLASILTAGYSDAILRKLGESRTLVISYFLLVSSGLMLVRPESLSWLQYLSPALMGFAAGITRPLATSKFNRLAGHGLRGRALSYGESVNAIFTIILILSICLTMDSHGIEMGLLLLSAFITVLSAVIMASIIMLDIKQNAASISQL